MEKKKRSNSSNWMHMEQLTGSKLEQGYFKTAYCRPAYVTSI